ncbi:hypothetical protein EVAR_83746_1 [Eumeta japonica]|uniref:Uncharacterized protein n=1 Tax=Eumeta variegata TaxID=151549 RepID=A0A4C1WAG9_EUMVA|nr:hypothetical protein EVAR_83746_1 [Eumeta japonica]
MGIFENHYVTSYTKEYSEPKLDQLRTMQYLARITWEAANDLDTNLMTTCGPDAVLYVFAADSTVSKGPEVRPCRCPEDGKGADQPSDPSAGGWSRNELMGLTLDPKLYSATTGDAVETPTARHQDPDPSCVQVALVESALLRMGNPPLRLVIWIVIDGVVLNYSILQDLSEEPKKLLEPGRVQHRTPADWLGACVASMEKVIEMRCRWRKRTALKAASGRPSV